MKKIWECHLSTETKIIMIKTSRHPTSREIIIIQIKIDQSLQQLTTTGMWLLPITIEIRALLFVTIDSTIVQLPMQLLTPIIMKIHNRIEKLHLNKSYRLKINILDPRVVHISNILTLTKLDQKNQKYRGIIAITILTNTIGFRNRRDTPLE